MSRRASIALALGIAALTGPSLWASPGQAAPALTADDRKLLTFYAEADSLAAYGQAKGWPGYKFERYPLVVFAPDRVAFQFNGRTALPGFAPLPNPAGTRARFPIFVKWGSTRQLMPSFALSDYVQTVGGQKVIPIAFSGIRDALPTGFSPASLHYFPLLVHLKEVYPWYSEYMARGEDWIAHYPLSDETNFAMADLEGACLKRAVKATAVDDAQKATRWFIAVRQARQSKLSSSSQRHENYQEALVGAARYGSIFLGSQGSAPDYHPLDAFKSLGRPHPTQADLAKWLAAAFDVPMDARALTRERLTLTGIAEGMLLDRFRAKDWRKDLPGTGNLATLLTRAVSYQDGDRSALVEEARKALNYEVMLIRAQGHASNARNMSEAFARQDGWTVKIRLPHVREAAKTATPMGLRWAPPDQRPLEIDSRTVLLISIKELYFNSPTIDIRLSGVPTKFYSTEFAYPFRYLIVRIPLDRGKIQLDGRQLPLEPGRYTIARSLIIHSPKARLKFTRGEVTVSRGAIEIDP